MADKPIDPKIQAVLDLLGDPAEAQRDSERFQKSMRKFHARSAEYFDRYPNEWVVVVDGEVKAHSGDFKQLMKMLDEKRLRQQQRFIHFFDASGDVVIL